MVNHKTKAYFIKFIYIILKNDGQRLYSSISYYSKLKAWYNLEVLLSWLKKIMKKL